MMTSDQWKMVKLLFHRVLELEVSQQHIYLDENCQDAEVRREVNSLIANHRRVEDLLDPADQLTSLESKAMSPTVSGVNFETEISFNNKQFFENMIGKKLNNTYLIEEKIGEGGMGAVFRCTHLLLGNQVAIKVMSPLIINDSNYLKRFRREARVGWLLSHPNIIKVFEFSQSQEGLFFMVMEYIKGETLKNYIKEHAPLPLNRVIELLEPVCNALDITHKRKVLHRDLKPGNILISKQGDEEVIKLSDFGIIKLLEHDSEITDEGQALTNTGDIIGTLNYMSPEQIMSYKLTPASDIYSLGLILYEMLTGELPIMGVTAHETIMLKTKGTKISAPSAKFPFLPVKLDLVLQKTLSPMPPDRYQRAGDLLKALKNIAAD